MTQTHSSFRPAAFQGGGPGWDGKVVKITYAKVESRAWATKDGTPVKNKSGEQTRSTEIVLKGIPEGGDGKEEIQRYELPFAQVVSDGEGFLVTYQDKPVELNKDSEGAKFFTGLDKAGFNFDLIETAEGTKISGLVGARIRFGAEPRIDWKTKKPRTFVSKTTGKQLTDYFYVPTAVLEQPRAAGNGHANPTAIEEVIVGFIRANGGNLTKAELVKRAGEAKLDPKVMSAVLSDKTYQAATTFKYDGKGVLSI